VEAARFNSGIVVGPEDIEINKVVIIQLLVEVAHLFHLVKFSVILKPHRRHRAIVFREAASSDVFLAQLLNAVVFTQYALSHYS